MIRQSRDSTRPWRVLGLFYLCTLLFGIVHTQAPLYYSNQNQYFLHGLARGGHGHLDQDWLSTSGDPTPVFSTVVAFTYRYLSEGWFYLYYLLILGLYFASLLGIFRYLALGATPLTQLVFVTGLLVVHATILRWLCEIVFGWDYLWYFQSGLAGQYLLGPGYQPSVHGVLLLASIWLFLRDRPIAAGAVAGLTAFIHSTYLMSAGLFTFAYLCVLARERRWRDALLTGTAALAIVMPILIYNLWHFSPSDRESFAQATRILVHFRIPHHTEFAWWLQGEAWLQIAGMVLSIILVRDTRLFPVLAIPFACSLGLTLLQWATGSDTLALLFPWRTSATLVPVATTILLGKLVLWAAPRIDAWSEWRHSALATSCVLAILLLIAGGVVVIMNNLTYRINRQEEPMMAWVREHARPGDRYLVPVQLPAAQEAAFESGNPFHVRKPTVKKASRIPVDLQRFRIEAGTPIHVDFKSIPYKDVEVLEWFERLNWTVRLYERARTSTIDWRSGLAPRGLTHVLTLSDPAMKFTSADLELVYEDQVYRIYRLRK